jgi:hypothetical protein
MVKEQHHVRNHHPRVRDDASCPRCFGTGISPAGEGGVAGCKTTTTVTFFAMRAFPDISTECLQTSRLADAPEDVSKLKAKGEVTRIGTLSDRDGRGLLLIGPVEVGKHIWRFLVA